MESVKEKVDKIKDAVEESKGDNSKGDLVSLVQKLESDLAEVRSEIERLKDAVEK